MQGLFNPSKNFLIYLSVCQSLSFIFINTLSSRATGYCKFLIMFDISFYIKGLQKFHLASCNKNNDVFRKVADRWKCKINFLSVQNVSCNLLWRRWRILEIQYGTSRQGVLSYKVVNAVRSKWTAVREGTTWQCFPRGRQYWFVNYQRYPTSDCDSKADTSQTHR